MRHLDDTLATLEAHIKALEKRVEALEKRGAKESKPSKVEGSDS